MFSHTCTVFCYTQDPLSGRLTFYPRVLRGVSWYAMNDSLMRAYRSSTLLPDDKVVVNIPQSVNAGEYVPAHQFSDLADKSGFWTLQTDALVLLGDWGEDVLSEQFDTTPDSAQLMSLVPAGERFMVRGMNLWQLGSAQVRHKRIWGC